MKHGAGIYKMAQDLGCRAEEIIDFSSNINIYQAPLHVELTKEMITRYADSSYSELKQTIAKQYEMKKSQIALFNGASSAIFELFKNFKEKRVYLYAPLYGEYEVAAKLSHKKIEKINRLKALDTKPKKGSIVVLVNPSTPDGKYYDLEKLFKIWEQQKCRVVLDESFLEFENLPSFRTKINSYKKLYIIQSFSKFHSCAGVRIGAVFSWKENIKKLQIPLWNLSSFDVAFLTQRLSDSAFKEQSRALHVSYKKELFDVLKNSKLFSEIFESDANFFLVKSTRAKQIFEYLHANRVLVRTCDSFDYLGAKNLRFAVKSTKEHKKLKNLLKAFGVVNE